MVRAKFNIIREREDLEYRFILKIVMNAVL